MIECMNKKFDPNFHQAMLEIEDSTKVSGTVVQEIQKGYMMKDRLLRPSLVGVAKKRGEKEIKEETPEEKLKTTQEKLLRTMAEMENQRRRFEKEKQEAFEFGGFNFAAESLSLIDNIDRAIISFKNDESLKNNKDLNKIIDGIEIVKKDLVSIFKKKILV